MSMLFSSKNCIRTSNLSKYIKIKLLSHKQWVVNINRKFSSQIEQESIPANNINHITFGDTINARRDEAKRSILIQVQSSQSFKELHSYCSMLGTVQNMLHYSTGVEPMHFIIVEFSQETDLDNVLKSGTYIQDAQVVPVQSSFLWFRTPNKNSKLPKLKAAKNIELNIEDGNRVPKESDVIELLKNADSVSDQMVILHNVTKLNDVGSRLRFLVAKQVEMAVSGLFPAATALPFGSSVNGYGKMGCDLDLVLRLGDQTKNSMESRLVYHCKASTGSERNTSQRHMEAVGDIIQLFLPGCSQVRKILQARVPIIKYYQQLADVECDLSMTNLSGVYMSDFLYIMGSIDDRVQPLVFTIRKWAASVGLTNSSPGRWISNFSITLMVLAFLQTKKLSSPPLLPPLNTLVKMSGPDDKYVTDEGINCTFLRDVNKYLIKNPRKNQENLKTLLQQFFEYYSQFDFASKAICLNEAVPITKPEHSALYIVNPLERGLNVSKNVSLEELEKFKLEIRNAAWLLESEDTKSSQWGILALFLTKKKAATLNNVHFLNKPPKLIEVSKLFDDDQEQEVAFKSDNVKKHVESIKSANKEAIKKYQNSNIDYNRQKSGR